MSTLLNQFKSLFKDMYHQLLASLAYSNEYVINKRIDKIESDYLSDIFRFLVDPVYQEDYEHFKKLDLNRKEHIIHFLKTGVPLEELKQTTLWYLG